MDDSGQVQLIYPVISSRSKSLEINPLSHTLKNLMIVQRDHPLIPRNLLRHGHTTAGASLPSEVTLDLEVAILGHGTIDGIHLREKKNVSQFTPASKPQVAAGLRKK